MTAFIVIAVEMGLLSLHILSGNLILILISHSNDFSAPILCEGLLYYGEIWEIEMREEEYYWS